VAVNTSAINNKTDVATATEPIRLDFSGPVDKEAVAESVVIQPATSVTKQWIGSTLVITPDHPLAPNTTYTVSVKPKAVVPAASAPSNIKPSPTPVATPVVVHFSTVRATVPPVVPPSFTAANVTSGPDSRLGDSGTILNAVWTGNGQLLATRPAASGGSSPSASATTAASGTAQPSGNAATDVWLLSPSGTPLRIVAAGATLPSAPATGSMFAVWTETGGQARLDVRDLQGNLIASLATVAGAPDRPATWLGTDRLAYVDHTTVKVVDLHASQQALPQVTVTQGSMEASPSGSLLAVESADGSAVLDLSQSPVRTTALHTGATGFDWSAKGDLAFVVQEANGTDLYVAADGKHANKIASSLNGQTWSDVNWSPDGASLLMASRASDGSGTSTLVLINRDGTNLKSFGARQLEYRSPEWSPSGDSVLFQRRDDATRGNAFWVATASTSGANAAEGQALSEVDTFMQARLRGDSAAAQAELDSNAQAAYQGSGAMLLAPAGAKFDRYYPVTVQLIGSDPSKFLIGVRTFIAQSGGSETGYFEEQLTVLQQGQRYGIDNVTTTGIQALGHGPTVLSVSVQQSPPGQQIRVQFDADLKAETVNAATIVIKDQAGNPVKAEVSFDPDKHLATLSVHLRPGSTYQLAVTTAVLDINGTALSQEYDAPLVISR
jgi:hypothetical protein